MAFLGLRQERCDQRCDRIGTCSSGWRYPDRILLRDGSQWQRAGTWVWSRGRRLGTGDEGEMEVVFLIDMRKVGMEWDGVGRSLFCSGKLET